jgi:4-diphosphocytidyl-2-C-methyl-D-erythritol kinase
VTNLTDAAPAKINLYLHVTGKRPDGYHLLDSLTVFAGVGDHLSFAPADILSLRLTGPFGGSLEAEPDNLVLRAARALAEAAGIQPTGTLMLDKQLPVASGIGGGSADAAAALRLLCRAWVLDAARMPLDQIALSLGADVPVCLRNRPARMRGIGNLLTPAPGLPDCGLVLINPGVPLPTAQVFRAFGGRFTAEAVLPDSWPDAEAMAEDLSHLTNDLEPPAIQVVPAIQEVLLAIARAPDCLLARMSGSGATCFGLFPSREQASAAAETLARPGWWCWGGALSR